MVAVETIRESLSGAAVRYERYGEVIEWTVGELSEVPAYLLPPPEGEAGQKALTRLGRRAISSGPRCLQHIRDGVLGNVNWGGQDDELDAGLEDVDLDVLAERLFERAATSGFMVGVVAIPEDEGDNAPTIRRLGGYVEPITDPYDYDVVRAIAQITHAGNKWRVRVYDVNEPILREWTNLSSLGDIKEDAEPQAIPYPPRYRVLQAGANGLPVGDLGRALPLIQSEWASQVRGDRAEEATGFPQGVLKGEVLSGVDKRGPTSIIEVSDGGDFKFVLPGDLGPMHTHHQMKLRRLQEELRLPSGSLGTQTPSGEALREAASKFVQMVTRYAGALAGLLTELVEDYADAISARATPVSVDINREYEKGLKIEGIINLFEHDLIPHAVAVREVHPFVPTMTSAEVEAFLARRGSDLLVAPMLPSRMTASEVAFDEDMTARADAFQKLVAAGVERGSAARIVGLEGAQFAGAGEA